MVVRHSGRVDTTHDLVQRHLDSFNAGDADGLLADFAPDATWVTGDYAVPAGELRSFFEGAMRSIRPRLSLVRTIADGEAVAVEMTETWTHDDVTRRASLIAVFDLAAGRIKKAKIYREGSADA